MLALQHFHYLPYHPSMIRYDLDKLGWYEFEELIQTLLKASLGPGIEAWGGRRDNGRDAYYSGPLKYPSGTQEEGPFLFQCKFVEGANAAGANPQPLVLKAVRAECNEIRERDWPPPHFLYSPDERCTVSCHAG
jgi:hypothetical protein